MFTPQELQQQKFEKARLGSGYDMAQIDGFLDQLFADYELLYKENTALKAKMKVLAEKVEEYRTVDDQLRKTLYNAQIMANETMENAKNEAEMIVNSARESARKDIAEIKAEVELEKTRLSAAKAECSKYAENMRAILQKNIQVIDMLIEKSAQDYVVQPAPPPQPPKEDFAIDVPKIEAQFLAEEPLGSPEEEGVIPAVVDIPAPQDEGMETKFFEIEIGDQTGQIEKDAKYSKPEKESDTGKIYGDNIFTPKPNFDFTDLRFGTNYKDGEDDEKGE